MDCANIAEFDPVLYAHLLSCPTEVIPLLDTSARNIAGSFGAVEDDFYMQVG